MFIYLFGGGSTWEEQERGKTEFQADPMMSVQNPMQGLNPWTWSKPTHEPEIMTWAKTKSQTLNQLSFPGIPQSCIN